MTIDRVARCRCLRHDGPRPAEARWRTSARGRERREPGPVRTPRLPLLAALAALLMVVAAQPASAVFEIHETGNTGDWQAFDEESLPGARCYYNDKFRLRKISARPPIVKSFRPNGQKVGWRLKIVKSHKVSEPNNYADETVYQSKFQKDRATLSNPADFTRKTWIREGSLADSSIRFKVFVIIKWYRPSDGKAEGTATYRYEWFRQTGPGLDTTGQDFYCYRAPF